jgi:hypothetical protein
LLKLSTQDAISKKNTNHAITLCSSCPRATRSPLGVGGGHERLRCTLSENMRPPLQHYSYTQCNALLEYNVFGIGISGVRMRSKITPFPRSNFPANLSWRADSTLPYLQRLFGTSDRLYERSGHFTTPVFITVYLHFCLFK